HRNRDVAVITGFGRLVGLGEQGESVDRIRAAVLAERPAAAVPNVVHVRQRDDVVQALELAHDRGALRPRAAPRDVQVVPAGDGRVSARPGGGDPALEPVDRAPERTALVESAPGAVGAVTVVVHRAGVPRHGRLGHLASRFLLALGAYSAPPPPIVAGAPNGRSTSGTATVPPS